jgi:hypothetical protein
LRKLLPIDSKWVIHQVTQIKGSDENNRKGALFEVLGLGYFDRSVLKVIPAKIDQAGFDGRIQFTNGAAIRLSFKNYGLSVHHQEFLRRAKQIEQLLKAQLQVIRYPSIQVFVDAPKEHATNADWEALSDTLPEMLRTFHNSQILLAVGDRWFVALNPLALEGKKLHEGSQSYTFILSSPYHQNEEQNLFSKLDEACYDLSKHSVTQDINTINVIYVHLPVTASLTNCANWANNYLSSHIHMPIAGILLYQPSVVVDFDSNTTLITHCYQLRYNDNFTKWTNQNPSNPIPIQVPVGAISSVPTEIKLVMGNETISVNNRYIYQSGRHYILANTKANGTIEGTISKVASGIFTHLVVKPFPNEPAFILSGHFAPEDKLLIL